MDTSISNLSGIYLTQANALNSCATVSSLNNYLTTASASSSYVAKTALTNSAIAFFNSSGLLSSSASNLYVQKGVNAIQSALYAVEDYSYSSVQLSSGLFIENIILSKTKYTLSG